MLCSFALYNKEYSLQDFKCVVLLTVTVLFTLCFSDTPQHIFEELNVVVTEAAVTPQCS